MLSRSTTYGQIHLTYLGCRLLTYLGFRLLTYLSKVWLLTYLGFRLGLFKSWTSLDSQHGEGVGIVNITHAMDMITICLLIGIIIKLGYLHNVF